MKIAKKLPFVLLTALLAVVLGYLTYVTWSYYRLEDALSLTVENNTQKSAEAGEAYTLVTYNLGFGAYSADYSFFMDGGTESRAYSPEAVRQNISGAVETVEALAPDFVFFQEVDIDSTRSYHIDESQLIQTVLPDYGTVFAQNYDSPYLFWPLLKPHGASRSGLVTLSSCRAESALRRSLPVESGLWKFLDLDRCYSITRIPVENGRTLCLYHVHLSAYTADGSIATEQLEMLLADMAEEYAAGNYVICGGDFNKDLLGDSSQIFGVSGEEQTWAQAFPTDMLPEGISLAGAVTEPPVPSCRNADAPYQPGKSFVLTVDGFLISENVEAVSCQVVDTGFAWSDHNPVQLEFILN